MIARAFLASLTHPALLASLAASFFALSPLTSALPARAAQSAPVETPGGSLRLILGAMEPDGTLPALLDIRLEPGWKTYWRAPGSSGIPPELSIEEGSVALARFSLPAPRRLGEGLAQIIGYDRPVAFPLALTGVPRGVAVPITAEVFVGICKDICIPVSATLTATLPADGHTAPLDQARIDAARKALPEAPGPDFFLEQSSLDPETGRLSVTLRLPDTSAGQPVDLFLSGPEDFHAGEPVAVSRRGQTARFEFPLKLGQAPSSGGEGDALVLTVRAGGRSMETPLAFD